MAWLLQFERRVPLTGIDLSTETNGLASYLKGINLANAELPGAYLSGADLLDANLSSADLHKAHLSVADLRDANLQVLNYASQICRVRTCVMRI